MSCGRLSRSPGSLIDARRTGSADCVDMAAGDGELINDAAAVGLVARASGIPYFVDAGQALGQIEVDVEAIGCDDLKGAGRKHLRGPRGTAILYVRKSFLPRLKPAFHDVLSAPWTSSGPRPRQDARIFETSEAPIALLLGLGNALREALALGLHPIRARIDLLACKVRSELASIGGVTIHDLGREKSGLIRSPYAISIRTRSRTGWRLREFRLAPTDRPIHPSTCTREGSRGSCGYR